MLDGVLVVFSLVPFGLLLFFWKVFPQDGGIHPIYRKSGIEMIGKRTDVKDAAAPRRPHMREVGHKYKEP